MTLKISIAATTGLLEAITDAGGNPDQILREIGLERSVLTNSDGFISVAILARFLEQAARATADDCLGLHFGERYNPKNIGPLIYVALNSPTIGAGFENVERYLKVHNEAAKWFTTVEGERAYIRYELTDLSIEAPRQYNEASMTIALSTGRRLPWIDSKSHRGDDEGWRPKLARVAKKLAVSPRTLQRKLKENGMEFKKLTEDTRRRFALNYLRDRKHTLTEVAFLLGYSDVSAFNRAFKRWTATTPLDYRRKTGR
jgi:AraC-like DNA-binding protein